MAGEILKFGSMIVDALREYEHPVYMYIPPHGELRGGSWVVVDPTINEEKMEMYADPDSRGGILEPAGITEVKFRLPDQLKIMHRLDSQLKLLDSELENCEFDEAKDDIQAQIKAREEFLKPVYMQAATEFADLHDKTGRMKAKGVIKSAVPWGESRKYFFYRAKRRMFEDNFIDQLKAVDSAMTRDGALEVLRSLYSGDWEDNQVVAAFYESDLDKINMKISSVKAAAIKAKIEALQKEMESL
jgi:acetyl-CoA carboxylase/biotin carboxylase 1